jgi:outer membrane protein assembly factor BamB
VAFSATNLHPLARLVTGLVASVMLTLPAGAADWPMYRHDIARTASTPAGLPAELHLQWTRQLPARASAFAYDTRIQNDDCYHPVVAGNTLLVGTEATNSLLALDTATGEVKWRFYTEGPIRYAPALADGVAFVAAEDGVLYAVEIATGRLKWKYHGAPAARQIYNHERLTSNWPASGGPIVSDGVVYFGAGVWPIDGTFAHAVDAKTGAPVWTRPAGVAWGYMSAVGPYVVLPSGKYPNLYDARTGEPARTPPLYDVKNMPTSVMAAWGDTHLFNGNRAYPIATGLPSHRTYANAEHHGAIWPPVIDGERLYGFNDGIFRIYRKPTAEELAAAVRRDELIVAGGPWFVNHRPDHPWSRNVGEELALPSTASLPADWYPRRMELKAGNQLFASGPDAVIGIQLGRSDRDTPRIFFLATVNGHRSSVIAADGKLFIADQSGTIRCYGPQPVEPQTHTLPEPPPAAAGQPAQTARAILEATGVRDGYCYVFGLKDGWLAAELSRQSNLRVIGFDPDAGKVNAMRLEFDQAGLLGRNLDLRVGDPVTLELPPYTASLIVSETTPPARETVVDLLRPYGGTLAQMRDGKVQLVKRDGALPGAADWTHERRDAANTWFSPDTAIKPPMSLLWYGGPAAEWTRTYRSYMPPGLQVVGGRYILQGHGLLSAVDVYTGRLLWEKAIPRVQYYGSYNAQTAPKTLLEDTTVSGVGRDSENPGVIAGEIGAWQLAGNAFNVVTMPDGIYMTMTDQLWVMDPDSGQTRKTFPIPFQDKEAKQPLCWGMIRIEDDTLVATAFDPEDIRACFSAWRTGNEKNKQRMPMKWLFAIHRHSGALLWKRPAENGFLNHGYLLGNGRVYAVDMLSPAVINAWTAGGHRRQFAQPRLLALELKTGRQLWQRDADVYSPEITYAVDRDMLVLPAREPILWKNDGWTRGAGSADDDDRPESARPVGRFPQISEAGVMLALHGESGRPLWRVNTDQYQEPVVIHPEGIIARRGQTYSHQTGQPLQRPDPVTGALRPWSIPHGGCNNQIASHYLVTRRTCYYDVDNGTLFGIRGLRSGCVPSIIPANGVMSVFNYTANYPSDELRNSLVLVHRPQTANWVSFSTDITAIPNAPIRRLGLNLGAPGDHPGPDGTPWLKQDKPSAPRLDSRGRPVRQPPSPAQVSPASTDMFQMQPAAISTADPDAIAWVAASGLTGIEELTAAIPPGRYTVRLHFAEPDDLKPGQRVFTVAIQGVEQLKDFDIVKQAGAPRRAIVREFSDIEIADTLTISLRAGAGQPLLCGVQLTAEEPRARR